MFVQKATSLDLQILIHLQKLAVGVVWHNLRELPKLTWLQDNLEATNDGSRLLRLAAVIKQPAYRLELFRFSHKKQSLALIPKISLKR